ncbi:hypothetical protein [Nocardia sp. CNY236]|uniref:hypothetical protein n=1 Tax=Nocardia sp. CNY236 TaxID=1169152 RepID=UPI0012DE291A|nr:hypothetical protein [Nocardia sp. CNY236]
MSTPTSTKPQPAATSTAGRGVRNSAVTADPTARRPGKFATQAGTAWIAVVTIGLLTLTPQQVATADPAVESSLARAAVVGLTDDLPREPVVPPDFPRLYGYHPRMVDGLLVNPQGDCSTPVSLPVEFDVACKAHDLGYDLLRYADRRGEPLGPWARQALDASLAQRMHRACAAREQSLARTRCAAMASIAELAVDLNSRRQNYGAPVDEPLLDAAVFRSAERWKPFAALAAGIAGLSIVLLARNRRRGGRPPEVGASYRSRASVDVR